MSTKIIIIVSSILIISGIITTILLVTKSSTKSSTKSCMVVGLFTGINTIAYSKDETNWKPLGNSIFSTSGHRAAWNGEKFVAVGEGKNGIAYSKDGIKWIGLGTDILKIGNGVVWTGSAFIAVGKGSNSIVYSVDGLQWYPGKHAENAPTIVAPLAGCFNLLDVGTGVTVSTDGKKCLAVGQCKEDDTLQAMISYDGGLTWMYTNDTRMATVMDVAYGKEKFVAVGEGGGGSTYFNSNSIIGKSGSDIWNLSQGLGINASGYGITYGKDKFVIVGDFEFSTIAYSDDGTKWTQIPDSKNIFRIARGVIWTGNKFIAFGSNENSSIAYSYDGIKWTSSKSKITLSSGYGGASNDICKIVKK